MLKGIVEIFFALVYKYMPRLKEAIMIHVGKFIELGLPFRPVDLFPGKLDKFIDMS